MKTASVYASLPKIAVLLGLALAAWTLYPNPRLVFEACPPHPCLSRLPGSLLPEMVPTSPTAGGSRFLHPFQGTFFKEVFKVLPSLPTTSTGLTQSIPIFFEEGGCHCVSAQQLVESPREGLRRDPEVRPDPRLGLGLGEPESPLSLVPFCRIILPSTCCPSAARL